MNARQHYDMSQQLMQEAEKKESSNQASYLVDQDLKMAQIHATLALAAWTATASNLASL